MTLSSQGPRPVPSTSGTATADARQDPAMRSLYRMSQTAGVGLQDYAAVNVFAVTGVLLAVASVLVVIFADVPVLLVIPAAAIVLSIVSFIQIQRSNGTQTGRAIAVIGVLVAGMLGGSNVYGKISTASRHAADLVALRAVVKQLETASLTGKAADGYALFDSRFQDNIKLETYDRTIAAHVNQMFGGPKMNGMTLAPRLDFETDANGVQFATGLLELTADAKTPEGVPYTAEEPAEFRKVDDTWKVHAIANWFPMQKAPAAGAAAGPAAPAGAR